MSEDTRTTRYFGKKNRIVRQAFVSAGLLGITLTLGAAGLIVDLQI